MPSEHYLQPNHKSEMPRHIICLDTEAWTHNSDKVQRLRLGTAIYMRWQVTTKYPEGTWIEESVDFHTAHEFHEWLDGIVSTKNKVRFWMFSHNMAYDFPILELDDYFSRNNWMEPSLFVPSTPFLYYTRKKVSPAEYNDMRVVSTTNWYNWPLKKLAPIFGTFKMELSNEDFEKISDEELLPYCCQDTRVVVEIVKGHIAFIRDNDLGTVQPTIAGQAFSAFRHRFMPREHPLLVHHRPKLIALELDSYKGGRTEALQLGEIEDVYILDVNSMYPSVMHTNPYPIVPKCKSPIHINHQDLPPSFEDDFIITKCQIHLEEPCIGIHRESDGKLCFPIGNIITTLTSPEISYLDNNPEVGYVDRYLTVAPYEWCNNLFTSYVDFFYNLKKNALTPVEAQESKLFLNSLYGKFGQRMHPGIKEIGNDDLDKTIVQGMNDIGLSVLYEHGKAYIRTGNRILVKDSITPGEVSPNAMPRIAAAVTAYSRLSLWEVMKTAHLEDVYYCDTDSIMTNWKGLKRCVEAGFCDESRLGALKWEGPYTIDFLSPKHYGINTYHWKNKGIRKNAKQLSPNSWEQDSFKTGMSRYREGIMDGVKVEKIIKTCKDIVDKGNVQRNGRVTPLEFKDF